MSRFFSGRRRSSAENPDHMNDGGAIQVKSIRDLEQHLDTLKKENFSLKLRIYFLEENLRDQNQDQDQNQDKHLIHLKDIHRQNAELQQLNNELNQEVDRLSASLDIWEEKGAELERQRAELEAEREQLEVKVHHQDPQNLPDLGEHRGGPQRHHKEQLSTTHPVVRELSYKKEVEPDKNEAEPDHGGSSLEFDDLEICTVLSGPAPNKVEGEELTGQTDDGSGKWAALVQSQARELVELRRRQEVGVGLCSLLICLLDDASRSLEEQLDDQLGGRSLQDLLRRGGATARRLQDRILGRHDDHDDDNDGMPDKRFMPSPENDELMDALKARPHFSPAPSDQSESFSYVSDTEPHNDASQTDDSWSTARVTRDFPSSCPSMHSGGSSRMLAGVYSATGLSSPGALWESYGALPTPSPYLSITGFSELKLLREENFLLQRRLAEGLEEAELLREVLLVERRRREGAELKQEIILSQNRGPVVGGAEHLAVLGRGLSSCSELIGQMESRMLELHPQQLLEKPKSLKQDEEDFIVRQLSRTRDVLIRAKRNLQARTSHANVRSLVLGAGQRHWQEGASELAS